MIECPECEGGVIHEVRNYRTPPPGEVVFTRDYVPADDSKVLVKPNAVGADVTCATVRTRDGPCSYRVIAGNLKRGRDMNTQTMKLRAGDVIELEIDGDVVSALVLLANNENVIFDLCDGDMPYVARQEDLANVRIFDGLAA